jgi:hypothetical protein
MPELTLDHWPAGADRRAFGSTGDFRHGAIDTADGSWANRLACLIAGVRCVRNWTTPDRAR